MKKLMIAAAIVCAAAFAQAAYVTWGSGDFTELPSCASDFSDCIKMYVWEFAADPGYTSAADVWGAYQKGELDTANAVEGEYDMFAGYLAEGSDSWTEPNMVYAAVLFLHDDSGTFEDPDYYMANIASAEAANAGNEISDLGNMIGGDGAATVWTATAVPEPTTGLLMLLGMAGLALRRRRA